MHTEHMKCYAMLQNIQDLNNHLRSVTAHRYYEHHKINIFREIFETTIEEECAINKRQRFLSNKQKLRKLLHVGHVRYMKDAW